MTRKGVPQEGILHIRSTERRVTSQPARAATEHRRGGGSRPSTQASGGHLGRATAAASGASVRPRGRGGSAATNDYRAPAFERSLCNPPPLRETHRSVSRRSIRWRPASARWRPLDSAAALSPAAHVATRERLGFRSMRRRRQRHRVRIRQPPGVGLGRLGCPMQAPVRPTSRGVPQHANAPV